MKKYISALLAVLMTFLLTACGTPAQTSGSEPYRAALLVTGTLGDKSFFDSAHEGLMRLRDELGEDVFQFKVSQMGGTAADQPNWEPTVMDFCDTKQYDVIIMGSWRSLEPLERAVAMYPNQKFIFFDETFDFEKNGNPQNLYNVIFRANEVSYLVGALAALMSQDMDIPNISSTEKKLGFLGGMNEIAVNDFLVGYTHGARDIDPDIEIITAYVGDYVDSVKGKDLAMAQYQNGVDIGFNAAGSAGLGQLEAATELQKYAFGTDSDQAALLPKYAGSIPSSAMKHVGNTLNLAIQRDMQGKLPYGTTESLGLADGSVGLVKDAHYEALVPADIRAQIDALEQQIADGTIVVETARK